MNGMSKEPRAFLAVLAALATGVIFAGTTKAQDSSIEFVAKATPSGGGIEEPVRGFPFFLLTKSYEDISKEVEDAHPKADMNAFIDKLDVSKELKAWMKKNQTASLSGEDFIHKVTVDDLMNVPEFYKAYVDRNSGLRSVGFPEPKFKPSDRVKNPEKYKKLEAEYHEAIRKYADQNPQSVDGIDIDLQDIDPGPRWDKIAAKRDPEVHRNVMNLAESKYFVARTETNLQGEGFLRNVPPGTYWLSTLDVAANVGDARPRWDVPVKVVPGQITYVALTNVNAIQPASSSSP
jgi:hypothetical protein